jgi:hypothetical protein
VTDQPIRYVLHDGTPLQPEPGPIWLESYEYGERMYVPGWVIHCPGCGVCSYRGQPHILMERLEGPGLMRL